ncbi:tRNA-dihydrouridine(16) synthase [Clostridia bacterium]|jgi:tRNA-dihydrouridine synthase C|nr:tRNA-dihydrouridine(16) synthase [Clostridia bacterium]
MDFWVRNGQPALFLAPMEGVTDAPMRTLLSEQGGYTHLVTEFLRVSQLVLPKRLFPRHAQELNTGSRTQAGTPVILQLLGGNAERLAKTAALAVECGARGIDLNFGCPAPTVNSHDGGATLLKYPHRIEEIVRAVRDAVPAHVPVSAKLRLGWDTHDAVLENAQRAEAGGASWIAIHGRTKLQGYLPPAHWGPIGQVRRRVRIPVIANGDLWTLKDFRACREETGCEHFMLGRPALANPHLVHAIARELDLPHRDVGPAPTAEEWRALLQRFLEISSTLSDNPFYGLRRVKQWLRYAFQHGDFAGFQEVKLLETEAELRDLLPRLSAPCGAPSKIAPKSASLQEILA